ncbi:hypothetical protein ED312_10460 [Sinomicrobium pectinilyticum]|uniref:Uncharacterized protein n=1 Tax=Sinomicrobium pectinilyticum TaxID=1084421 RepID=A0A3N0EHG3_SINP1|nr:hypothetical protein ED312_10460 [Sinomicrobium pectinilyticum]
MHKIDVMEAFYYLDSEAKPDGNHLVHTFACTMKEKPFPIKLGWQKNSQSALKKATKYYEHVKLCDKCTGKT